MTNNTNRRRGMMAVVGVAVALLMLSPAAVAQADTNPNPGIVPINSQPGGMTYGQWSAAWWQYAYSLPNSDSPLFDATGGHCAVAQPFVAQSKVFFLAAAVFGGTQTESCTVPAGTMVFFPVLNAEVDNGCPVVSPPLTVADLASAAKSLIDPATNLHASIDGRAVQNISSYRVTSPAFSFTLPAASDNLCTFFAGSASAAAAPGSVVSPVVGDGYYLMLAPLSSGQHTITFGGEVPGFTLDVIYKLTVTR
jgi:hypothetical protein